MWRGDGKNGNERFMSGYGEDKRTGSWNVWERRGHRIKTEQLNTENAW